MRCLFIVSRGVGAYLLVLVSLGALWGCSPQAGTPAEWRVSLQEAREAIEHNRAVVFDIREPSEHATGVAAGMQLLPMSQLNQRLSEIPQDPAQPVLIICNTQNRSSRVVQAMRDAGWSNVQYVHGGMDQWTRQRWPVFQPMGAAGAASAQ